MLTISKHTINREIKLQLWGLQKCGLAKWGLQKCAAVEVNRGKLTKGGNLTVSKDESIQIISKDDHYKFLGMVENSKQLDELITQALSQEYIRRLSVIWTSNISIPRKIKANDTLFWTST